MIIEIPDDNSIVKWKKNDKEDWKTVEISDLIKAYENPKKEIVPVCKVTFDKEQLQEIVDKAVAELVADNKRPEGKWILVSERLPNRNGVYNVTRIIEGTRLSDVCYFDGQDTWHSDICVNHGRPYLNDIIAWQELPEPYKKGGVE